MSKVAVQIYEIQEPREAEALISLGVDRIGSVLLSEQDWKVESVKEAVEVSRRAGIAHSIIPLFNRKATLFRMIDFYGPDAVHFCESLVTEDGQMMPCHNMVELQNSIREKFPGIKIIRSIPIALRGNIKKLPTMEIASFFAEASDYLLIDTWLGKEPVDGFIGITGQTCDWSMAKELIEHSRTPVILAGGLSKDNVHDAVKATKPWGVDSCTKTNLQDEKGRPIRFKKDFKKVKSFMQEVRRAECNLDCL